MRQQTLLKIVGLMRKDLNKRLTILEISKKLKIGYRPAYNHINSMNKEGIIQVEKVGNSKLCSLRLDNPKCRHILGELDSIKKEEIYAKHPKVKKIIESLVSKLTNKYISEIHSVVLFGSYAKMTATKASDIDLVFIVSNLKNKSVREAIERESSSYQYSHNTKVSSIITDITEFKKMLADKALNVGKESRETGISIYGSEMFWRLVS